MADPGIFRGPHQVWQRANINAAAAYFRELLAREPGNTRVKALHDGLLDVLDPTRRATRQQRELATATQPEKPERRRVERRSGADRRKIDLNVPAILDRRAGTERRSGRDRRKG